MSIRLSSVDSTKPTGRAKGSGFGVQNWIEKKGELFVGGIGIFERGREKHFYDQGGMN